MGWLLAIVLGLAFFVQVWRLVRYLVTRAEADLLVWLEDRATARTFSQSVIQMRMNRSLDRLRHPGE